MSRNQIGGWAGMLGAGIFVGVFTIEGLLRPGYDAVSMFISELSLGPRGWVQIASFLVTGALYAVFTWGVAGEFRKGKASRFGPILLAVISLGFFVSGPLVMDPVDTPRGAMTLSGYGHGVFGALVFTLIPIVCWVFVRRFREDKAWRSMWGWTLAAAIITTSATVLLSVATKPPLVPNVLTGYDGLIQRALIVPFHVWAFLFANKLRVN
jgi:hypothetical protein